MADKYKIQENYPQKGMISIIERQTGKIIMSANADYIGVQEADSMLDMMKNRLELYFAD
ncbi:hypothetical protein KAR91_64310 [Candidatus Pacearchaeota archaeon]|nr:hypothetical protein [Candidatus Pacearchaeota archaeon]